MLQGEKLRDVRAHTVPDQYDGQPGISITDHVIDQQPVVRQQLPSATVRKMSLFLGMRPMTAMVVRDHR